MAPATSLEFLLVTTSYHTLTAVTEGLDQIGARFDFSSTAEAARDYVGRRKIDGIFVDLEVPGAQDLILSVRQGISNRNAAIFACLPSNFESAAALVRGATGLLQQPLNVEDVISQVSAARNSMVRERRRCFRHAVNFQAVLTADGTQQRAVITNLSEGGMAAYLVKPLERLGLIDFVLEMPGQESIAGKGSIAWANNDGNAGITFHFLRGQGEETLQKWLREREATASQDRVPVPGHKISERENCEAPGGQASSLPKKQNGEPGSSPFCSFR